MDAMKGLRPAIALLSGAVLALAFPGVDADFLVWLGLTPLLLLLESERPGRAFAWGFLAGIGFFGVLLRWVLTLRDWIGLLIIPVFALLIAFQALYWGAFGLGVRLLRRVPVAAKVLALPALWVAIEFARASGPLGLPWGGLGYALHRRWVLIQMAEITGVWGISFAIVAVNCLIAQALRRRSWRPPLMAGFLLLALWGLGQGLLHLQRPLPLQGEFELKIALIQPNVPQREKADPRGLERLQTHYERLLSQVPEEATLAVLPESILPAYLLRDATAREPLDSFVRKTRKYLLFGTLDYREGKFHNTAALLAPTGVVGRYDKVRLVPFSTEYVPLRALWERLGLGWLLQRLAPAELTPGKNFMPLALDGTARLGTPICFESAFPGVSREFVRNRATLLVTITDDAWFDHSAELEQHFSFGVFRAIETRRWFVQVANTGLSGVITPRGRVVLRSQPEQEEVLSKAVYLLKGETFYVRYGDWFAWGCVLLAGMSIAMTAVAGLLARRPPTG